MFVVLFPVAGAGAKGSKKKGCKAAQAKAKASAKANEELTGLAAAAMMYSQQNLLEFMWSEMQDVLGEMALEEEEVEDDGVEVESRPQFGDLAFRFVAR